MIEEYEPKEKVKLENLRQRNEKKIMIISFCKTNCELKKENK